MPKRLLDQPRLLIFPLFLVSGFCGLIYESIWAQYLKLFLGHAAYAQTVVLVVFIGGMAVGAWLCGRFASRIKRPLVAYAIAEFVVGWFGIAFHGIYVRAVDWAYGTLLPLSCNADGTCVASWLFVAALILPQSILLGTTFPLMATGALRLFPAEPGRQIALLYFLNSLGAVAGVLASTFVLIPIVGLPGASNTAGAINVLVAMAVYSLGRDVSAQIAARGADVSSVGTNVLPERLSASWLLWVAFFTGLASFVYEIVWIRMLSLVLGSSMHAFELMLAAFILGLALGGAWIRNRIDRLRDTQLYIGGVQIAMGMLAVFTLVVYNATFDGMAWLINVLSPTDDAYTLFNIGSAVIAIAMMLPATFMAGMTLPLLTHLLMRKGNGERSVGYVYASNTFGSIGGVILAVHLGLPLLGVKWSLAAAALVDVALGVILVVLRGPTRKRPWLALASACTLVVAAVIAATANLDPRRSASGVYRTGRAELDRSAEVLFARDGKTATVAVVRTEDGVVSIRTNGKPDAGLQLRMELPPALDEYTMVLLAVLPLAHYPAIRTVANIGFGSGLTAHTLLGSPAIERVDTIEIEPQMYEGAKQFGSRVARAYNDPRSHVIFDDARAYFARSGLTYDLIVSEPSNPWVSGTASLFTAEFYARIRRSLNPHGVFVQWIQAYEFTPALLASITAALDTVFSDYVVYATYSDLVFVARVDGQLDPVDPAVLRAGALEPELGRLGIRTPIDLDTRRLATRKTLLPALPTNAAPVNADFFPYVENEAPRARFRHQNILDLLRLRNGPVPYLDIMEPFIWSDLSSPSEPPTKVDLGLPTAAFRSDRLVDQVSATLDANVSVAPGNRTSDDVLSAVQAIFVGCSDPAAVRAMWDKIVQMAATINPSLPASRLDPFWSKVGSSRCVAQLPREYREWIALFRAVGNRDYRDFRQRSETLLEAGDLSQEQTRYLIYCAMIGNFMVKDMHRMGELSRLWQSRFPEVVKPGWFQTLSRYSSVR